MVVLRVAPVLLALALLGGCPPKKQGTGTKTAASDRFDVRFHTTAEASYTDIHFDGAYIVWTTFEDKDNRCAQWVASTPCWKSQDLTTRKSMLDKGEFVDLRRLIESLDFFSLRDTYGGARAGRRYYSETLRVVHGGRDKTVAYHSFPEAQPKPAAFAKLEAHLRALVRAHF